jgi:hypothetical protein
MGVLVTVLLLSTGMAEPETKYVDVSFSMASSITLHEPVYFNLFVANLMPYALTVDLGWRHIKGFDLTILAPDGKILRSPLIDGLGEFGTEYLRPGERYSKKILLNEWYSFDEVGDYRFTVKMKLPIIKDNTALHFIRSTDETDHQTDQAGLTLTVLPRNEAVLKQRCDALIRKLHVARRNDESTPVAVELSYITDPIAIPYMKKLVDEKEETSALNGLTRIGTDEAWEAMIAVTKSKWDKRSAEYAKSLLRQKLLTIRNPNIREKVEVAVR